VGKDLKGSGRDLPEIIDWNLSEIKALKIEVRIDGAQAKIRSEYLTTALPLYRPAWC
jgi:hypothetical protein